MFGPELVMLRPDERFTQLSLSGGKPKRPNNVIKSLSLLLGPDFCSDIIAIEIADHDHLRLQLSYSWWALFKIGIFIYLITLDFEISHLMKFILICKLLMNRILMNEKIFSSS